MHLGAELRQPLRNHGQRARACRVEDFGTGAPLGCEGVDERRRIGIVGQKVHGKTAVAQHLRGGPTYCGDAHPGRQARQPANDRRDRVAAARTLGPDPGQCPPGTARGLHLQRIPGRGRRAYGRPQENVKAEAAQLRAQRTVGGLRARDHHGDGRTHLGHGAATV